MIVQHEVQHRYQVKMNDCWYACVGMLKSAVSGTFETAGGQAALDHRGASVWGQSLSFVAGVGPRVMAENNLMDVSTKIRLNDMRTLALALQEHGPLIACGRFGPGGFGHAIVIGGCNTGLQQVTVHDPGWFHARATAKPWTYITRNVWQTDAFAGVGVPRVQQPGAGAFLADDPNAFFNQETRGRR